MKRCPVITNGLELGELKLILHNDSILAKSTFVRLLQFQNADEPIVVILPGIVMYDRLLQSRKADSQISDTPSEIVTEVNP